MARDLVNRANAPTPDADYPFSKIIDDSAPGANDGVPINEAVNGDHLVLLQKIMSITDITPNENPDNESNGYQLLTGIQRVGRALSQKYWTTGSTQANLWSGIAYGNGLIVQVSRNGTNRVALSDDYGVSWSLETAAEANIWRGLAYGAGLFVAVSFDGTNRVMTSPDGVTWTSRTAAEANQWNSITFDGTNFVAVSGNGTNRVMTSPDGITWTARSASAASEWYDVSNGAGVLIAVANSGTNRVMRSTDNGQSWTTISVPATANWKTVEFGNGIFVAAGDSGDSMYSTDLGLTWTDTTGEIDATANFEEVSFCGGIFVLSALSATTSKHWESIDGVNWWSDADTTLEILRGVYAGGAFVFVGPNSAGTPYRGV